MAPRGVTTSHDVDGDVTLDCDVVVVGTGAGGATSAAELADGGLDVVMVEEGGYHETASFTTDAVRALRTLYRDAGAQTAFGRPPVTFSEGRCVGGAGLFVADAALFPGPVGINPMETTLALAMRNGEWLLEHWGRPTRPRTGVHR
jgi:choline dehydrogenase-like flavoprotein